MVNEEIPATEEYNTVEGEGKVANYETQIANWRKKATAAQSKVFQLGAKAESLLKQLTAEKASQNGGEILKENMDKIADMRSQFTTKSKDLIAALYKAKFAGQEYVSSLQALNVQHNFDMEELKEKVMAMKKQLAEETEEAAQTKPVVGISMIRSIEADEVSEGSDDEEIEAELAKNTPKLSTKDEIIALEAEIEKI